MAIHTVADVKVHLGMADASLDPAMAVVVASIEQAYKTYTKRLLEQATVSAEKHVGDGRVYLDLRENPLSSVTQLKIASVVIAAGASSWEIHDAQAGRLFRPGGWDVPSNAGQNNIEVTYVAGFAPGSPEVAELKLVLVEWSAARFRLRNKVEFQTESFQDHSAVYWADMPGSTRLVLNGYKRVMS